MALIPENRMEQILAGENITPNSREESFVKEAIDNAGSGGGGSLPTPGTVGNVLTSTGDGWESAAPQGGGLAFTLILGEDSVACDVAVTDIVAALDSKRPVFGTAGELGELIVKSWNTERNKVVLYLYIPDDTVLSVIEFVGTSGTPDTWEYSEPIVVDGLQSVSPADNGKILGVDNGAYALVTNTGNDMLITLTSTGPNEWAATYNGSPISITEMITAYEAGKNLRCTFELNGQKICAVLNGYDPTDKQLWFGACVPTANSVAAAVMYGIHDDQQDVDAWVAYAQS